MISTWQFGLMLVGYGLGHVMKAVVDKYLKTKSSTVVEPRVSWFLWFLNQVLYVPCALKDGLGYEVPRVGYMLGRPLTLEGLMKDAEKRTGLRDWAPNETFPALFGVAVEQMNEVDLSPFGRLVTFDYLMRRLVARLRVVAAAKDVKRPKRPVREPLFVMGLPRTGTTLLHRLLSLDDAARCPRTFELLDPVPKEGLSEAQRIAYWASKLRLIKRTIPQVEAIHELGATKPEECLLAMSVEVPLLPPTFRALVRHCVALAEAKKPLPSMRGAYELYKTQLELLDGDGDGGDHSRWVLKCPAHLAFTSDLARVFPDAKVVWTHRDPAESLPSLGSMFRTFADMCFDEDIDLPAIGREQLAFWGRAIRKADADLGKGGPATNLARAHVTYAELTADPVSAVKRIYDTFGWAVSPAFEARMRAYLDANADKRDAVPTHLKKFHDYTLEQYGLDANQLKDELKSYYSKHLAL